MKHILLTIKNGIKHKPHQVTDIKTDPTYGWFGLITPPNCHLRLMSYAKRFDKSQNEGINQNGKNKSSSKKDDKIS